MLALASGLVALSLCQCPAPGETIQLGIRPGVVEFDVTAATVEVPIFATHVDEPFPAYWQAGLRYDASALELVDLVEPDAVGDHPFNGFAVTDERDVVALLCTQESFQGRVFHPDARGEALLCTLVFRVLRATSEVSLTVTDKFRLAGGLVSLSGVDYCGRFVAFASALREPGALRWVGAGAPFARGDVDGNDVLNVTDIMTVLQHLFLGVGPLRCVDAADANDSGRIDLADAVFLLEHFFRDGMDPPAPYPEPGVDPTADGLGCSR